MRYTVTFDGIETAITQDDEVAGFLKLYQCTPRIGEVNGLVGKWKSKGGRHIDVITA